MMSETELRALVLAALRGRPSGASEDEIEQAVERAIDWGSRIKTQSLLLELIVQGHVNIALTPTGELRFYGGSQPSGRPSEGTGTEVSNPGRLT